MRNSQYKNYLAAGVTAFCVIAAAIVLFFLLSHTQEVAALLRTISSALRPVFIGMIIAFLLLPVHRWIFKFLQAITDNKMLENPKNVSFLNTVAIFLSLLVALFALYLLLAMVVPQVYLSVVGLVQSIPDYISSVQVWLQAFLEDNPDIQAAVMPIYDSAALSLEQFLYSKILPNLESVPSTIQWLQDSVLPNLTGVVSNVSAMVSAVFLLVKDLLIALIVSFYLLAHKDLFAAQSKKIVYSILPTRHADLLVEEVRSAYRIMSGFINGKLLDSLIIGVITLICCNLFHFPYPVLVATVVGVTNVIPFFGPYIGAIPCALLILLVSPVQCVYFVIFIVILQQFDGNILGPKILGESTGLSAFWVLFSILLFGGLFGFAGMILGVPVFAMIYSIVRRLVCRGLKRHGLPVETEHYLGRTGPMA
jgi:predicted PurR-regulated permease PerM